MSQYKGCASCAALAKRIGGLETGAKAQAKRLAEQRERIAELEGILAHQACMLVGAHEDLVTLLKLMLYHSHRSEYVVTREMISELPGDLEIYTAKSSEAEGVRVRLRRPGESTVNKRMRET